MLHDHRIREHRRMFRKIFLTKATQHQPLGLQRRSRGQRRESHAGPRIKSGVTDLRPSLFGEGETAESLVEARDLAAFLDLARAADPRRVDLRIDLEVEGVALLAPGRAGLE